MFLFVSESKMFSGSSGVSGVNWMHQTYPLVFAQFSSWSSGRLS